MPSAKGLFHKAVVLSGASVRAGDKAMAEKLGSYVLAEAGLQATEIEKLQQMPWKQYLRGCHEGAAQARGRVAGGGNRARRPARRFQPVGRRHDPAAAPVRAGGGADRGQRPDDHLLDRERAGTGLDRRHADERDAAAGRRSAEGACRLRARPRREGEGRRRRLRQGVPGQEAGRNLVARQQQPPERGDAGRRQGEAAGAGVRELVRVAAAALRRPHRRVPLRGHLLLVQQHRPDATRTPAAAPGRASWPRRCRSRSSSS